MQSVEQTVVAPGVPSSLHGVNVRPLQRPHGPDASGAPSIAADPSMDAPLSVLVIGRCDEHAALANKPAIESHREALRIFMRCRGSSHLHATSAKR